MQNLIDNLINGNLTDARKLAKRHKLGAIVEFCERELGWTLAKAYRAAVYLKTGEGFQAFSDAV